MKKNFNIYMKMIINFIFMDEQTYEQIELGSDLITEYQSKFLVENANVTLQFYNDKPVGLELPDNIVLKVLETEAVVKGQTAASSYKPALLEKILKQCTTIYIN